MAENHRRNAFVFEMPLGLRAEEPIGEAPAGRDRHRREWHAPGDIAEGIDPATLVF